MKDDLWNVYTWDKLFTMIADIEVNEKRVGMFFESFKSGCDRFNNQEKHEIIQILHSQMIEQDVFNGKKPRSMRAVRWQVEWSTSSHKSYPLTPSVFNQRRMTAYSTGWMMMTDILELEKLNIIQIEKPKPKPETKIQKIKTILDTKTLPLKIYSAYPKMIQVKLMDTKRIGCHYEIIQIRNQIYVDFHIENKKQFDKGNSCSLAFPKLTKIERSEANWYWLRKKSFAMDINENIIADEFIAFINETKDKFMEIFAENPKPPETLINQKTEANTKILNELRNRTNLPLEIDYTDNYLIQMRLMDKVRNVYYAFVFREKGVSIDFHIDADRFIIKGDICSKRFPELIRNIRARHSYWLMKKEFTYDINQNVIVDEMVAFIHETKDKFMEIFEENSNENINQPHGNNEETRTQTIIKEPTKTTSENIRRWFRRNVV